MTTNALLMNHQDNVVTCVTEVAKGEKVVYKLGETLMTLTANQSIPYCHKIALTDIAQGQDVLKYGEMIGRAVVPIGKGCWVSHENIKSVPRDYDSEML